MKNTYKNIEKWGVFILAIIIVVAYSIYSMMHMDHPLSVLGIGNVVIYIVNLLAAFYVSRFVSVWGWKEEN